MQTRRSHKTNLGRSTSPGRLERGICDRDLRFTIEQPDYTYPQTGRYHSDRHVHVRGEWAVVVNPTERTVITVLYRDHTRWLLITTAAEAEQEYAHAVRGHPAPQPARGRRRQGHLSARAARPARAGLSSTDQAWVGRSVTSPVARGTGLPVDYPALLEQIKAQVRSARIHAARVVNVELIALHWRIGRLILDRQAGQGRGAKVIDRLAADLAAEFPGMRGFSPRNLR